ncbi:Tolloid-like protein 2 [Oopsacas minuta]|uniref:Metalloendopeptidase n=1 Tax=Oopsacas minuta TaxID=111878 RepID=A0AAV7JWJ9_9METZ|nr:Tolloid-like protein 2 [Oopsacas minuta]
MHLIGHSTISILIILLYICYVFPAQISDTSTTPPPEVTESTGDMKYVYIPEDEYVQGPYDFAGDPCSSAATYEGDIGLGIMVNPITNTSYILLPSQGTPGGRDRRGATANPNKLWPNALVPYAFHSSIADSVRGNIIYAMKHWEELTCIRFTARTTEYNYIEFFKGAGCCSFIGRLNLGRQYISIGQYCNYFSSITHEIGHSVGFWHEMNRPDRDEYIQVNFENIPTYLQHNFGKLPYYHIDSRGVTYDYNSVMHYTGKAFSINGKDTIEALEPGIPIGPEYGLSQLDALQANLMYSCSSKLYIIIYTVGYRDMNMS